MGLIGGSEEPKLLRPGGECKAGGGGVGRGGWTPTGAATFSSHSVSAGPSFFFSSLSS